jgi:succinyl-CoA synthetase beta subunit
MQEFSEKEAENFLEKQGFDLIKRKMIKNKSELSSIEFNFPWVMKVSSKNIIHKSKTGGVITNIKTLVEASNVFDKLSKIDNSEGVMIQSMQRGYEIILGLKNTKEFGLSIIVGNGGTQVESKKDVSFRITPITKGDAQEMIDELKIADELKKQTSIQLITDNLLKLSKLAEKYPQIQELDINPLIVNKTEAKVVDARMILN